jgi:mannose-1-phosphate guanylyltransferase
MVPVLNKPFLEHVIRQLSSNQIKEIVLAKSHLSQPIENYFGDGSQFGVRLNATQEDIPLGTAGAIKNVENFFDESFLVLNGDIYTDLDIKAMIAFHHKKGAKITIALTPVDNPTSYGLIETDTNGRVTRFLEKPQWSQVTTNLINAGTYVVEPEILAQIPSRVKVSIEREVFPRLLERDEPVYAYPSSVYWKDIGTPEEYLQLHRDLLGSESRLYASCGRGGVLVGEQCSIDPMAKIEGAVLIGDNCTIEREARVTGPTVIGPGCQIMTEAVVEGSVIWRDARLGPRSKLINSILADHCYLKADCVVEDSILGDDVTLVKGCKLAPESKIWPGTTVGREA